MFEHFLVHQDLDFCLFCLFVTDATLLISKSPPIKEAMPMSENNTCTKSFLKEFASIRSNHL